MKATQIWRDRLHQLRTLHALGMQLLADADSLHPPDINDGWERYQRAWNKIALPEATEPPPEDAELCRAFQEQLRVTQLMLEQLAKHYQDVQKIAGEQLAQLREVGVHRDYQPGGDATVDVTL